MLLAADQLRRAWFHIRLTLELPWRSLLSHRSSAMIRRPSLRLLVLLITAGFIASGCVRRTLSITSDPPGALLWLNGREVGRTPVDVDFIYYGVYDVQLVKDGYEPLLSSGHADAP